MSNELTRSAVACCDDRLASAPCFEDHDSERFVTTWHADQVGRFEEADEVTSALVAEKPGGGGHTEGGDSRLQSAAQVAVAGKNELRARVVLQQPGQILMQI